MEPTTLNAVRCATFAVAIVLITLLPFADASHVAAGNPPRATTIDIQFVHTCAAMVDGPVQCWGENFDGQLGNDTKINSALPIYVNGMINVVDLGVQDASSCALTATGGVKCWGWNGEGELGDGTGVSSPTPVDVVGLQSGVVDIDGGELHACAVLEDHHVKCWGWNYSGNLGDGTTDDRAAPVTVLNLDNAMKVYGGEADFTCALKTIGGVVCWGNNVRNDLGANLPGDFYATPQQVVGLTAGVTDISAGGDHACAVLQTGHVKCWGFNLFGQLGNGNTDNKNAPVDVVGLSNVVTVAAGHAHTCALHANGDVECWGNNNAGQLGTGDNLASFAPVPVQGLDGDAVQIAAGGAYTCALMEDGSVKCWGFGGNGQLGNGLFENSNLPVDVQLKPPPVIGPQLTQGDNDCDGDSDAVDALVSLQNSAGLPYNQQPDCLNLGSAVPASAEAHLFGDIDCDGDVDAVDALQILRNVAGLPANQNPGCTPIGQPLG